MFKRMSRLILTTAALFLGLPGGSYVVAQTADSARISDLLKQTRESAVRANNDAHQLESYSRSRVTWRSHADQLRSMKEHVNAMGKLLTQMDAVRTEGSPWQQEAIKEVEPLLRSMADHLTTMIDHLNANQEKARMPEYVNYTKANRELSDKLLATIQDYLDYSEANAKVKVLEQKLKVPAPAPGV